MKLVLSNLRKLNRKPIARAVFIFAAISPLIGLLALVFILSESAVATASYARPLAAILSLASMGFAIWVASTIIRVLGSIELISDHLKELKVSGRFDGRLEVDEIACVSTLADEVNSFAARIEEKERKLKVQDKMIAEREEQNAMLWLEIEHNLNLAKEDAETDPLTGLFNRKSMVVKLERAMADAQMSGKPLSVLMADLDHFKKVNDTYGHQVGDEVLKAFAKFLKNAIRGDDLAVRYGGEEFLVILPSTHVKHAIRVAKRINKRLPAFIAEELADVAADLKCTVSVGVSDYPACARNKDELIATADSALYEAKQAGRDLIIYSGDMGCRDTVSAKA
ncbi:MAG: GGDEF domain-containing protein [Actinobacteria bacterium]|nr:GGDEF domain-containing protein [Actinomycetota bacterium]